MIFSPKNRTLSNSRNLEDFNVEVKPLHLKHDNCDVWSLGICVLEIYLSLYVLKKDARDMVHNMYLNKMSYQSRCQVLNELLDGKSHPVIMDLFQ